MDSHGHCNEKCNKHPRETNYGIGDMLRGSDVPHYNYKGVNGNGLANTRLSQLGDDLLNVPIHAQGWPMQIPSLQSVVQFLQQISPTILLKGLNCQIHLAQCRKFQYATSPHGSI